VWYTSGGCSITLELVLVQCFRGEFTQVLMDGSSGSKHHSQLSGLACHWFWHTMESPLKPPKRVWVKGDPVCFHEALVPFLLKVV